MKKIVLALSLLLLALSSCDYETQAYKKLKFEKDSVLNVQALQSAEMDEYLSIIQDVDSGFELIRETQEYLSVSASEEGGTPTAALRTRITDDMLMISEIMQDNQDRIDELEQKLEEGKLQSDKWRRSVYRLQASLKKKNNEIMLLQADLEQRNYVIDSLLVENQMVSRRALSLEEENLQNQKMLSDQDSVMHQAYYIVATKKEIKADNLDPKKRKSAYRTSLFTPVDLRDFKQLATYSRSVKVLSKHPENSYVLKKGSDKNYTLYIKNATDFWSISKFLVVKAK